MLDYGIIGNCVTCALVKKDASIEWMCYPAFSDPSIFAKILDRKRGGSFGIKPAGKYNIEQRYLPGTAILETKFSSDDGSESFVVYDFFPRYKKIVRKRKYERMVKDNKLVRIIRPLKGRPKIKIIYDPKPDYARSEFSFDKKDDRIICSYNDIKTALKTNVDFEKVLNSEEFSLDSTKFFVLEEGSSSEKEFTVSKCNKMLDDTRRYWEKWSDTLILPRKNKDMIIRSAITLKLLTYSSTGAIIAAATTSIPEEKGTSRTFDYRFCWVRDATLCVDALKKLGRDFESKELLKFIMKIVLRDDFIQPIYDINGNTKLKEEELEHLEGYAGSRPVRIGNAAYNQIQNDIYGSLIDIIYLYFVYYEYEKRMTKKYWRILKYTVNQIKFNWMRKDSGIWEYRNLEKHYTYSKLMCFVGVDRAIKIAQHFGREEFIDEWLELREEIREDIMKNGYNSEINAFTLHYDGTELDAANLLMAYHEFLPGDDPMLVNTIREIYSKLRKGYGIRRYDMKDDFGESKNIFTICTFWMIDALYYIGEEDKARKLYDEIIKKANHLGLFSEDIDVKSGELIGNFPQAYTHIALINSSILLSEWSVKRKKIDWSITPKKGWF